MRAAGHAVGSPATAPPAVCRARRGSSARATARARATSSAPARRRRFSDGAQAVHEFSWPYQTLARAAAYNRVRACVRAPACSRPEPRTAHVSAAAAATHHDGRRHRGAARVTRRAQVFEEVLRGTEWNVVDAYTPTLRAPSRGRAPIVRVRGRGDCALNARRGSRCPRERRRLRGRLRASLPVCWDRRQFPSGRPFPIRVGRRSRRRPDFRSPYTQQFNEGACGITHMLTQVLLNFLCFSQRVG
jgi:hypothetical protein